MKEKNQDAAAIGQTLAKLRNDAGLSQRRFADAIGKTQAYISRVEAGKITPSLKAAKQMADALGVSPVLLLTVLLQKKHLDASNPVKMQIFDELGDTMKNLALQLLNNKKQPPCNPS